MKLIKPLKSRDSVITDEIVRTAVARGRRRLVSVPRGARLPVVIVKIPWYGSVERMRLDLRALARRSEDCLVTHEWWTREKVGVTYQPRVVDFGRDGKGAYVIELVYSRAEHKDIPVRQKRWINWGSLTLTLAPDFKTAVGTWRSEDPKDAERWDGDEDCEVRLEQPSQMRQEFKDVRAAQASFKKEVLKFGNRCELTQERVGAVLDAAHVHDVEHGGPDEPENGILLRADLHRLFDKGYFTIETDGSLRPHPTLSSVYAKLLRGTHLQPETLRRIAPYLQNRRSRNPKD